MIKNYSYSLHFPAGSILLHLNLTLRLYPNAQGFFFYLKQPHTLIKWSYKEKVTSIQSYYFQYLLYKFIKTSIKKTYHQLECKLKCLFLT